MKSIWLAKATLTLLLLETGLRISSAKKLRLRQFDPEHAQLRQVWAKGTRFQDCALSVEVSAILRFHVELNEIEDFIFDRDIKTLYRWVRDIGELAGVKLHPHKLRHTFATILLDATHDIQLVQQALGHASINSTLRYTRRSDDKVRTEISKAWDKMHTRYRR